MSVAAAATKSQALWARRLGTAGERLMMPGISGDERQAHHQPSPAARRAILGPEGMNIETSPGGEGHNSLSGGQGGDALDVAVRPALFWFVIRGMSLLGGTVSRKVWGAEPHAEAHAEAHAACRCIRALC
eukprot:167687-Chlamydomonas_euryale.AAC.2